MIHRYCLISKHCYLEINQFPKIDTWKLFNCQESLPGGCSFPFMWFDCCWVSLPVGWPISKTWYLETGWFSSIVTRKLVDFLIKFFNLRVTIPRNRQKAKMLAQFPNIRCPEIVQFQKIFTQKSTYFGATISRNCLIGGNCYLEIDTKFVFVNNFAKMKKIRKFFRVLV